MLFTFPKSPNISQATTRESANEASNCPAVNCRGLQLHVRFSRTRQLSFSTKRLAQLILKRNRRFRKRYRPCVPVERLSLLRKLKATLRIVKHRG